MGFETFALFYGYGFLEFALAHQFPASSMAFHRAGCWTLDPFEQENERNAGQSEQAEQSKVVHERPEVRLAIERGI